MRALRKSPAGLHRCRCRARAVPACRLPWAAVPRCGEVRAAARIASAAPPALRVRSVVVQPSLNHRLPHAVPDPGSPVAGSWPVTLSCRASWPFGALGGVAKTLATPAPAPAAATATPPPPPFAVFAGRTGIPWRTAFRRGLVAIALRLEIFRLFVFTAVAGALFRRGGRSVFVPWLVPLAIIRDGRADRRGGRPAGHLGPGPGGDGGGRGGHLVRRPAPVRPSARALLPRQRQVRCFPRPTSSSSSSSSSGISGRETVTLASGTGSGVLLRSIRCSGGTRVSSAAMVTRI